jgi:hypothetical protein
MPRKRKKAPALVRPDGRRPLLVYMRPDLVINLKKAALDEGRNAYELVEDAVGDLLAKRDKSKKARASG